MSIQTWVYRGLCVAGMVLGLAQSVPAMLIDNGLADYTDEAGNNGQVNLIYDTDLDITWIGDANLAQTSGFDSNGSMTWLTAVDWASGLTVGGQGGWRLPSADVNGDETVVFCDDSLSDCATGDNEMGFLHWIEGISVSTPGPFSNLGSSYWSGTEFALNPAGAWRFRFTIGANTDLAFGKNFAHLALAVHSGNVPGSQPPQVPEPSTMLLMGSGLMGLLGWRRLSRN